jgi:hypothetical protein
VILGPVGRDEEDGSTSTIGEFAFTATLSNDPFEGSSLNAGVLAVADGGERWLLSHLYQLPTGGVCNQFVGDHGFTGLVYVAHPVTTGTLQFTCRAE